MNTKQTVNTTRGHAGHRDTDQAALQHRAQSANGAQSVTHPGTLGATLSVATHSGGPMTAEDSFKVHLQSLDHIGHEIGAQSDGLKKPEADVAGMLVAPLRAGDFGEAVGLGQANTASLSQMQELLGQVKAALQFADEVTAVVANGYRTADVAVAQSLGMGGASTSGQGH